jgi:hypothetical protein
LFLFQDQLKPEKFSKICECCWNQIKTFEEYFSSIHQKHESKESVFEEKSVSTRSRTRKKAEPIETISVKCEVLTDFGDDQDQDSSCLPENARSFLEDFLKDETDVTIKEEEFNEADKADLKDPNPRKKRKSTKSKSKDLIDSDEDIPISNLVGKSEKAKESEEHENLIKEFLKMSCDLCDFCEFHSFKDVKSHFRTQHSSKGYLKCCNKKFFRRFYLIDHLEKHKNPDAFNCKECGRKYPNRNALRVHMTSHGNLDFKCSQPGCEKAFSKKYKLNAHLNTSHIPESELTHHCDLCSRKFNTARRLEYHQKQMHCDRNFICDFCGRSMKTKANLEYHRRTHTETEEKIQRIQCSICSHWLKDKHSFRKHTKRHEEEKEDNICNFCGKRALNKDSLKAHIRYVHLKQRTHQCPMCEKAFKTALNLKEHIASHGSGQTLYECSVCSKTFNSNANMHSHRYFLEVH